MDIKTQLKSLLQEAEIYRSQGLLDESKNRYNDAVELIQKNAQIKNKQNLLENIQKKINLVNNILSNIGKASTSPQLSSQVQNVIKNKFSFSDDQDSASLEGAIALAKFGQFESALKEFNELVKKKSVQIIAAKNIIRCYNALNLIDEAVVQYEKWLSSGLFPSEHLEKIRFFLENILERKGNKKILPHAPNVKESQDSIGNESYDSRFEDEEFLDISSITISLDKGPLKGKLVEFDVSFQSANIISVIIPEKDKKLIENLVIGATLNNIQFYSPIAIFKGNGVISAKTRIQSGPKKGNYRMDIKVVST
ncbi:MAG: hypothetical protein JW786_14065 [Desulfobacterales bacterium]|nr:hypothetical protein [Desulfobacterales bacterium]